MNCMPSIARVLLVATLLVGPSLFAQEAADPVKSTLGTLLEALANNDLGRAGHEVELLHRRAPRSSVSSTSISIPPWAPRCGPVRPPRCGRRWRGSRLPTCGCGWRRCPRARTRLPLATRRIPLSGDQQNQLRAAPRRER